MEVTLSPRARVVVVWIAVIAGGFVLLEAAHALRPFVWAVITAYILHPLVSLIHRKTRLPKHLITGWLYAMLGLVVAIVVINLVPLLIDQVRDLQDQVPDAVEEARVYLEVEQGHRLRRLGLEPGFVEERLNATAQDVTTILSSSALPLVLTTFSVAIELIVYLVATFYFIVYGDRFILAIRDAFSRRYHREFDRLLMDIHTTMGAYIRGQALLVAIMSVASFTALTILDVNYALSVAIATGLLELIPLIGPWTAGSIAVTIARFQDSTPFGWTNLTLAIVVGLTYFGLRQAEDSFIIPLVIGRIVHLHPLLVIFVLVVGTSLGGVLGLILAVPIAAVLKIVASFFFAKVRAREVRHVETIRSRRDLGNALDGFPDLVNSTIVLLVEPDVLAWEDLPLVQRVAEAAQDSAIALSVVTTDGVAGALATAAGIPTTTIPVVVEAPVASLVP